MKNQIASFFDGRFCRQAGIDVLREGVFLQIITVSVTVVDAVHARFVPGHQGNTVTVSGKQGPHSSAKCPGSKHNNTHLAAANRMRVASTAVNDTG
eukprot:m.324020 g.324020  ORF g.324020 m.324020 type:complete len:96 (+) comp20366_c0_seq1:1290-1577(+)